MSVDYSVWLSDGRELPDPFLLLIMHCRMLMIRHSAW